MSLDIKKFLNQQFEPRVKDVPVPQLKPWFASNGKGKDKSDKVTDIKDAKPPVWTIRALNADEIGRADEAVANEGVTTQLMEALTSMNSPEVSEKVKELMGASKDTPKTIAKRTYHLIYGSVEPKCDYELAGKLRNTFPVIFYELTNEILQLSGQGFDPKK